MRYKIFAFTLIMLAAFVANAVFAGDFGLGAMVGEPTGLSGKAWSNDRAAIDFAMAWSLDPGQEFNFHADYLVHDYSVFNVTRGKLPLYYGIGGRLLDASDTHLGLRGVIGVDYLFRSSPLDLFFEVAPVLDLTPATEMDMEAAVGMRFYFR